MDENQYDELNYGDIPEELWKIFPSNSKYIMNIMKFCGYDNRESILRLKCEKEVSKMFKFVVDREKLVTNKEEMFGIFAADVTLLTILPGFKPTFKRFLTKVENLVPNRTTKSKRNGQSPSEIPIKKKSRTSVLALERLTPNDKIIKVEELIERFKKWLSKEVQKKCKRVSIDDQEKSFSLKSTDSNSFSWMCLQNGCFETVTLTYSSRTKSVSMYSAQRHVRDSCWLSGNKKPQFSTKKKTNFFGTPKQTNITEVPKVVDIEDDSSTEPDIIDFENMNTTLSAEVSLQSPTNSDPKNLQVPVGTIDPTKTDGH